MTRLRARTLIVPVLCGLLLIAVISVNAALGIPALDITGHSGETVEESFKLADQVMDATKTLFGMATGVLGLVGFLFSDKVSTYWERANAPQRQLVLTGAVIGAFSIATGLMITWAIIQYTTVHTMKLALGGLFELQLVQVGELALALALLASVAITGAVREARSPIIRMS